MVDNEKSNIEKILQGLTILLIVAIVAIAALLAKATFLPTESAPRTSVEKQLYDAQKVLKKDPNDISARLLLGFTYTQMGENNKAEHEFLQVIKLDKKNTKAYYLLGQNYEQKGEVDNAIDTFLKIDDYDPALYQLGRLSYMNKKYEDALKYLNMSLKKEPTASDTLYYLGQTYEKLNKKDLAKKKYQEALKYSPDFKPAEIALKKLK